MLQIESFRNGFTHNGGPLIIAGPCSVESETQLLDIARALASLNQIHIFRAGVWKPRTRPGQYEGSGRKGLAWLVGAGKEVGLPVATEVATARHVEQCLEAGVDLLWVGARTTVNPFYVQEIADALRGVDIPVMVKNPIHSDIKLWVGALERINKSGIKRLAAIHRGFFMYDKGKLRNAPMWHIVIELKTKFPQLDILCDPSHIAGDSRWVASLSQKAIDLDMAGLMIESHIDPKSALSDAGQQILPCELSDILNQLVYRSALSASREYTETLRTLRTTIDQLDEQIITALAKRMDVSRCIGSYKNDNDLAFFQVDRWDEIIKTRLAKSKETGLETYFLERLIKMIHLESIRVQRNIAMNPTTDFITHSLQED